MEVGARFSNYEQVVKAIKDYQDQNCVQLYKRASHTTEAASRSCNKKFADGLIHSELVFVCIHGAKSLNRSQKELVPMKHSDTFLNKESFLCATEKARVADLLKMQPNKSLVQQQLMEDTANVAIQKDQHNITPSLDNEVKMAITKRRANESYETLNEATCSFSVRLSSQSFL
ncbi:hypothetical protein CAPTEDRAFT_211929 [Capitella teleta]|uniref:ZSWIM3 N-terminal domain-containing protein n=1 Tax=Capitella teleta TaxID=283909 RepID=R7V5Y1_CAPTE|nr:hypothetical protein CAPTEDRAFT_211929 [Capitella teleta]|eukprot:ELU13989.1 hypothetical protein CAPTEDRAFT_211929 [Capitella teleta]